MIDFTLPCETDETPPRPVLVLLDKDGNVQACILGGELWWIDSDGRCWKEGDNEDGDYVYVGLRNVAPKPVRHEGWINIAPNNGDWSNEGIHDVVARNAMIWKMQDHALKEAAIMHDVIATVRCVWNSDGSPVEDDEAAKLLRDAYKWKAKAEEAFAVLMGILATAPTK